MVDICVRFGKQLRKLRQLKGWSQEELADASKLHVTYIGQIERGLRNPSLVNLHKIARGLRIKSGDLLPF